MRIALLIFVLILYLGSLEVQAQQRNVFNIYTGIVYRPYPQGAGPHFGVKYGLTHQLSVDGNVNLLREGQPDYSWSGLDLRWHLKLTGLNTYILLGFSKLVVSEPGTAFKREYRKRSAGANMGLGMSTALGSTGVRFYTQLRYSSPHGGNFLLLVGLSCDL